MNKEEFKHKFNNEYPYSCMTVLDLKNIINAWPGENMPFSIDGSWSWRGIYAHPCLGISTAMASKKENLRELQYVLEYSYEGWKGGTYYYNESSLLHFETDYGVSTTAYDGKNCWFIDFMEQNEDNPFIQSIYDYFENDKHLISEYHEDYLGNDLKIGKTIIYCENDKFKKGYIKDIDTNSKSVAIIEKNSFDNSENIVFKKYDQIIQINDL